MDKHLLWKVVRNILPTQEKISNMLLVDHRVCLLCAQGVDSIHHLIFTCLVIIGFWWNSKWQLRIENYAHRDMEKWFEEITDPFSHFSLSASEKEELLHYATVIIEHSWMTKNKLAHEERERERAEAWEQIGRNVYSGAPAYRSTVTRRSNRRTEGEIQHSWSPLPKHWTKINYDAALRTHVGAGGGIAKNSKVYAPSSYNGILGRPALNALKATISILRNCRGTHKSHTTCHQRGQTCQPRML